MGDVLVCAGLRRSFGDLVAVRDVGFRIGLGETYGLLGPNGAGKTTTISMICGLLEPDAGEARVDGQAVTVDSTAAKAAIGYVPQELAVYPDLTATENLAFFGRLQGLGGAGLRERIDRVLEVTGLTERRDDRVDEYSGGMKRRLNIGIGLLHEPKLLVLDEPTVGVDPQSRNAILEAVEQLAVEGMGVLYTTHYMEEAERLCDRVAIIDEGEIRAEGTRRELVALVGQQDRILLGIEGDVAGSRDAVAALDGITSVSDGQEGIEVLLPEAHERLTEVLAAANSDGSNVRRVEVVEPNLEAVFLHLTGRALRDA